MKILDIVVRTIFISFLDYHLIISTTISLTSILKLIHRLRVLGDSNIFINFVRS